MSRLLPKKVTMLEVLCRDGMQHARSFIPTETKLWFLDQFTQAGFEAVEVTNFAPPKLLPQHKDSDELMKRVWQLEAVKQGKVHLKCYGMNKKAFERAAQMAQNGYPPHSVAFTISTEDLHCYRNAHRTREEYLEEIPEFVRIAKANGFDVDMAIACAYGSPCAGPVPVENTIELIERGLDLGIRRFTPCDTTGECNPLLAHRYMSALVDKFGRFDDEVNFRVAHFHESRGMALANYTASILGGARIVEASLGQMGGQPAYVVDGVPGIGTGHLYTNSDIVGNASTEDIVVMLEEMGINTGVDVEKVLQLGRVLEWVFAKSLRPYCTKSGRPIKQPVEWAISASGMEYIPPYGEANWASPEKYRAASADFIASQFEGRKLRSDPWGDKVRKEEAGPKKPASTRRIATGTGRRAPIGTTAKRR
jgi:hydroxymethylglutaryl-CoA lyase